FAEKVTLFAIEGTIDHISRVGERGRKLPVEIGIVLDHEETQGQCSHRCDTPESALAAVTLPLHKKSGKVQEDPGGEAHPACGRARHALSPHQYPLLRFLFGTPTDCRRKARSFFAGRVLAVLTLLLTSGAVAP